MNLVFPILRGPIIAMLHSVGVNGSGLLLRSWLARLLNDRETTEPLEVVSTVFPNTGAEALLSVFPSKGHDELFSMELGPGAGS